jgi:hypothetical protein
MGVYSLCRKKELKEVRKVLKENFNEESLDELGDNLQKDEEVLIHAFASPYHHGLLNKFLLSTELNKIACAKLSVEQWLLYIYVKNSFSSHEDFIKYIEENLGISMITLKCELDAAHIEEDMRKVGTIKKVGSIDKILFGKI